MTRHVPRRASKHRRQAFGGDWYRRWAHAIFITGCFAGIGYFMITTKSYRGGNFVSIVRLGWPNEGGSLKGV